MTVSVFDCYANTVADLIHTHSPKRQPLLVGLDGRCTSGKTTFAHVLEARLHCPVIHMDHFFLRPHMRTPERLATPGGNVDHERFLEEVMVPLRKGQAITYRPFDCHTLDFRTPITVPHADVILVEGTYALCPALREYYDLRLFLTVDPDIQLRRIEARNGAGGLEAFRSKWIPLEEKYFHACRPWEGGDLIVDTTSLW